jgi:hypothetical protein
MKTNFFLSLIFAFGLLACDEVEKFTIQDVSAPVNLDLTVSSTDTNMVIKVDSIDASTNKDFMDNRSKIDDLEIDAIQWQVKGIGAGSSDSLVSGKLEVKNPGTGQFETLKTFSNKKLIVGVNETLTYDANVANFLVSSVRNQPYRATIRYQATMANKPVQMVIGLTVRLKLKVKV